MQFPESWLRQFCNPPLSTQQLADTLTMAGLEVESLDPVAPPFEGVVVGHVIEVVQHPNADRLRVCTVDVGPSSAAPLSIVCGAPNARVGIRVPCARVGAVLPPGEDGKPFVIRLGKLRGVESSGMLCSAKELGVSDESSGLLELPPDAPIGESIRSFLSLDDTLFTLKLTPNLAHCLSVYGVARELSALTGAPLQPLSKPTLPVSHDQRVPVRVQAPDLCGRFSGRVIRNVNPKATTPRWMADRLLRCGQRPVSPLVDISNYVMFERGRPTHVFDLEKLHGGLTVRWAQSGESLALLNGSTVALDESVGVIADDQSVESLAGIMGGASTAVSDDTRHIYVEAAFWWPKAVAGRSRRFGFSTDAGYRFERGVDPQGTVQDIEYISALIQQICGGEAGPLDDQVVRMPEVKPVALRVARAQQVIGMPLSAERCRSALEGLGLAVTEEGGVLTVTPPSHRFDLQIEEDLIEEVVRVVGYDNLPSTAPQAPVVAALPPEGGRSGHAVRRLLASLGYQETINFSFVERSWETDLANHTTPIELLNPIASHLSVMRSTLMGSLLNVAKFNTDRQADRVCVFEIGRVFRRDASVPHSDTTVAGIDQPLRVAGLLYGPRRAAHWEGKSAAFDFYDLKSHVEALLSPRRVTVVAKEHPALHPGRSAFIEVDGQTVGVMGELHPRWRQQWGWSQAPLLFELDFEAVSQRPVPAFQAFSKFPAVERDLALWVPAGVTHAQLQAVLSAVAASHSSLQSATLFDVYRPKEGAEPTQPAASWAVRLRLQKSDGSLADAEIDQVVTEALRALESTCGARLRT